MKMVLLIEAGDTREFVEVTILNLRKLMDTHGLRQCVIELENGIFTVTPAEAKTTAKKQFRLPLKKAC